MDGQEYLDRISAKVQMKNSSNLNKIFESKLFWVGAIGLIAFVLILIVGALLKDRGPSEKDKCLSLLAHLTGTSEVITEYQPSIKSSGLRSSSASFSGVLANTSAELDDYVTNKYSAKSGKDANKRIQEQAEANKNLLDEELFEAKINGILDRIYANKMAYEISTLIDEENSLLDTTKDDSLKEILSKSYGSLENLYDKFENFSETTQ